MNIISKFKIIKHIDLYCLIFRMTLLINMSNSKISIKDKKSFWKCYIRIEKGCELYIGTKNKILKSNIKLSPNSNLTIKNNNFILSNNILLNGIFYIGNNNIFNSPDSIINIENGKFLIGDFNRCCATVWIRFNGKLSIKDYNTINANTEIRCDELIEIGSYNQISMNNRIWDTNTHCFISDDEKYKQSIVSRFPNFDEVRKPKTSPTRIGDCNWIGESCFIKGGTIECHCIVGTRTMLINKDIPNSSMAINDNKNRIIKI